MRPYYQLTFSNKKIQFLNIDSKYSANFSNSLCDPILLKTETHDSLINHTIAKMYDKIVQMPYPWLTTFSYRYFHRNTSGTGKDVYQVKTNLVSSTKN